MDTDSAINTQQRRHLRGCLRPERFFAVVALLVMIPLALLTPAGANYDEPMHIFRVDQVAHLNLFPDFVDYHEDYPTDIEQQRADAAVYGGEVDDALGFVTLRNCEGVQMRADKYIFPTWKDEKSMLDRTYGVDKYPYYFSNTVINSPAAYLPYYPGLIVGEALKLPIYWLVVLTRMCSVVFYTACMYFFIVQVPFGRWALVALALLPNHLATVAGVSADTMTNLLCFSFLTVLMKFVSLDDEPSLGQWVWLGVTVALLPLAKIVYSPFLLLLVLLPLLNRTYRAKCHLLKVAGFVICGMALFIAWSGVIKGINPGAMWRPNVSPSRQIAYVLQNPLLFMSRLLQAAPFADVFQLRECGIYTYLAGPAASTYFLSQGWTVYVMLALSTFMRDMRDYVPRSVIERRGLVFGLLVLVGVLCSGLVFGSIYATYSPVGFDGFEGIAARYFIPVTLLFHYAMALLFVEEPAPKTAAAHLEDAPQESAADSHDLELAARAQRLRVNVFVFITLLVQYTLILNMRYAIFVR